MRFTGFAKYCSLMKENASSKINSIPDNKITQR